MMRRSAGFDADEARRQLLKEWQNVTALELTANDYITCRVNSVDLKNRLSDIETDGRDRLHVWLLQIVGASTAPTSMALPFGAGEKRFRDGQSDRRCGVEVYDQLEFGRQLNRQLRGICTP